MALTDDQKQDRLKEMRKNTAIHLREILSKERGAVKSLAQRATRVMQRRL